MSLRDRLQKRQQETESSGGGNFWKPKKGKNIIRIFPYTHEVTKADVKAGLFSSDELGEESEQLDRPVVRHFGVGDEKRPVLSTPRLMQVYKELKASDDADDQEKAKSMKPTKAFFLNVLDINDPKKGIVPYGAGMMVYKKILGYLLNEDEYGGLGKLIGPKGRDFIIIYDKDADPSSMYQVQLRDVEKCDPLPSSYLEQTIDFYDPKNVDVLGAKDPKAEEDDTVAADEDDEDVAPAKKVAVEDDEDEEPVVKKKASFVDEDVDEEPKKKKSKATLEDDEDVDDIFGKRKDKKKK